MKPRKYLEGVVQITLAFCAIFAVSLAPASAETVLLRCEPTGQVLDNHSYDILELNFSDGSLRQTTFFASGSTVDNYSVMFSSGEKIVALGESPVGQPKRLIIDRNSGYARSDFLVRDENKPNMWNEEEEKMGYPIDEEIWFGHSMQCRLTKKLF